MAPFKSDLVKKRAALKCKVTILLKKTSLHAGEFNDAVTDDSIVNQIEQLLAGIEGLDSKISEQFLGEDECEDTGRLVRLFVRYGHHFPVVQLKN